MCLKIQMCLYKCGKYRDMQKGQNYDCTAITETWFYLFTGLEHDHTQMIFFFSN